MRNIFRLVTFLIRLIGHAVQGKVPFCRLRVSIGSLARGRSCHVGTPYMVGWIGRAFVAPLACFGAEIAGRLLHRRVLGAGLV